MISNNLDNYHHTQQSWKIILLQQTEKDTRQCLLESEGRPCGPKHKPYTVQICWTCAASVTTETERRSGNSDVRHSCSPKGSGGQTPVKSAHMWHIIYSTVLHRLLLWPTLPSLPRSVNEYQLRLGRERQVYWGMVHSVSGLTWGVQVKLWDPLKTCAIPEHFIGVFTMRHYTNPCLPSPLCCWQINNWMKIFFTSVVSCHVS